MLNTIDNHVTVSLNAKRTLAFGNTFSCATQSLSEEKDSFSNSALSAKTASLKPTHFSGKMNVGQIAPDFTLKNHRGEDVKLSQELKKGPVVLFFFPRNNTKFCTKQIQTFQKEYPKFKALNATILGISSDSIKSQEQFINEKIPEKKLPFELLSDPKDKVRKQFDAQSWFGIPSRVTYVINPVTKQVNTRYSSQAKIQMHMEKALEGLESLHKSGQDIPES
jgi:peroxiredoxin Q/BCP